MGHPLATIEDPSLRDIEKTIVVSLFIARETLSIVGQNSGFDTSSEGSAHLVENAMSHIASAAAHIRTAFPRDPRLDQRTIVAIERATSASQSLLGHIRYSETYGNETDKRERARGDRSRGLWRRGAENACSETHKLLALVVEAFPESFKSESFDED
ncbi:MAG: hypothetical protein DRH30_05425 [Deltaproteobacteria bacterium]|nr:MAG: hypothetical protein DRH30_05425 [Deltaproteobacteria bacterium]